MNSTINNIYSNASTVSTPTKAAIAIKRLIYDSRLTMGAMLPPERKLSDMLGFSYIAIRAANQALEAQGLIRREHGRGTFIVRSLQDKAWGIASQQRKLVGYVHVSRMREDDYALQQFHVMERYLKAKGHSMVLGVLHEEDFGRALPISFDSLNPDAFIIDGHLSRSYLHQLVHLDKPVVVAGNHSAHENFPCVEIDYRELSRLLTKALFGQGMDAVCMISEPLRLDYTRELLEGYRQALLDTKSGIELLGLWEQNNIGRMTESLQQMFAQFGPKLGLLGYHDEVGFALNNLAALGVDVTQSVAVVGIDHQTVISGTHMVYEGPVDNITTEVVESMCRLLNGELVGNKVLHPVLQRLEMNGRVQFDWEISESKLSDGIEAVSTGDCIHPDLLEKMKSDNVKLHGMEL